MCWLFGTICPISISHVESEFYCWRFGTICSISISHVASEFYVPTFRNRLFHLHSWCSRPMKMEQSVPKRRNIKFWRRGITYKKEYNKNNVIPVQAKKAYEECSFFGRPLNVVCIYIHDTMSLFNVTQKEIARILWIRRRWNKLVNFIWTLLWIEQNVVLIIKGSLSLEISFLSLFTSTVSSLWPLYLLHYLHFD